jgi:L,D-peptidoglycan transpeptidase YkuD (ErfK/YbiS/YcfS/YnhG family)
MQHEIGLLEVYDTFTLVVASQTKTKLKYTAHANEHHWCQTLGAIVISSY